MSCIFCEYLKLGEVILQNGKAFAIFDKFPVNEGHLLVIPKRHFADYFDAQEDEILAINSLLHQGRKLLKDKFQPDGFNIGVNVGYAGGQTIFHLHIHLIPRYEGDVENPRGGVRNLKKALVHYDG